MKLPDTSRQRANANRVRAANDAAPSRKVSAPRLPHIIYGEISAADASAYPFPLHSVKVMYGPGGARSELIVENVPGIFGDLLAVGDRVRIVNQTGAGLAAELIAAQNVAGEGAIPRHGHRDIDDGGEIGMVGG